RRPNGKSEYFYDIHLRTLLWASAPACQPAGRNACPTNRKASCSGSRVGRKTSPVALQKFPMQATRLPLQNRSPRLKEYRNDQDRDNVYHFDHGIDRWPGRVLVGIAHGVA